jgi:murein DD-endopeptidase MepM/ murein hydrolase activator NlpD
MKRIIGYLMIFLIIFGISFRVEAKTLRDLKNELAAYEKEMNQAKNKKKMTQSEINNINSRVKKIRDTIEQDQNNIKKTEDEIKVLEQKAEEKEDQIKDIISFLQITSSENAYMEYVFGAQTMEDMILRSAVSEQMVVYNDDLIEDYNNTIIEYKAKNESLKKQITNLNSEQDNLKVELVSLGDSLDAAQEEMASVQSQIDAQKKLIKYYQKTLGCKDDQDITKCGTIPFSGKMIRPLTSFSITSEYGYRIHPISRQYKFHSGMDLAGGSTDVYAVAPGTVAGVSWKNSCGGTMLFIHHNINGSYYTVTYMHLYKVNVKVGDYVDQNTKVAVTGGYKSLTPWDSCSTGRHLHFSISRGLYLKDYTSWSTWTSKLINPRSMVNFPRSGVWVSNRTKQY